MVVAEDAETLQDWGRDLRCTHKHSDSRHEAGFREVGKGFEG